MTIQVACHNCGACASALLISCGDDVRHGSNTRRYYSVCVHCKGEYEVVDCLKDDRWVMIKYRPASGDNDWTVVGQPVDAPLIVVGPGGEYYKAVPLKDGILDRFFKAMFKPFKTAVKVNFNSRAADAIRAGKKCV